MEVRVLGCYGGNDKSHGLTSFLVNGHIALDAGALTNSLSHAEQLAITDVIVSHIHFDHTCGLPFLVDNQFGKSNKPLTIHATASVIEGLRRHMFNDLCWPDFSRIPHNNGPSIVYQEIRPGQEFTIGDIDVLPVGVDHLVPTVGFVFSDASGSWVCSSDTGATEAVVKVVNKLEAPKLLFLECSFPRELEELAVDSKHLTPAGVERAIRDLQHQVPLRIYHCKPLYLKTVTAEIEELNYADIAMLKQGDVFKI